MSSRSGSYPFPANSEGVLDIASAFGFVLPPVCLLDCGTASYATNSQAGSPIWRRWWRSFQMLHQRGRDLIGQRQFQGRGGLALLDSQDALSLMDVVEGDGNHFAGVGSNQQKHRVVAQTHGRCRVQGLQKSANRFPR